MLDGQLSFIVHSPVRIVRCLRVVASKGPVMLLISVGMLSAPDTDYIFTRSYSSTAYSESEVTCLVLVLETFF